jgi:hypothetical protein
MKKKQRSRKAKDLAVTRGRARRVKGGAVSKTGGSQLSPPSPPAGPIPIPYPNWDRR